MTWLADCVDLARSAGLVPGSLCEPRWLASSRALRVVPRYAGRCAGEVLRGCGPRWEPNQALEDLRALAGCDRLVDLLSGSSLVATGLRVLTPRPNAWREPLRVVCFASFCVLLRAFEPCCVSSRSHRRPIKVCSSEHAHLPFSDRDLATCLAQPSMFWQDAAQDRLTSSRCAITISESPV
jgi:hypothetical protein